MYDEHIVDRNLRVLHEIVVQTFDIPYLLL